MTAKTLDHGALSGKGDDDHTQYLTEARHDVLASDNPHTVTKAQVGLGNVTDDAQLKRSANDISTFTEKVTPVNADILIIEDSAAAGVKKKVQLGNLPGEAGAGCRVTHSVNQSIPQFGNIALNMDTELFDTDTMHDTSTNNTRITFQTAGRYVVGAQVQWSSGGVSVRFMRIRLNGTTDIAFDQRHELTGGNPVLQSIATVYDFSAGDYIEVTAQHGVGGSLNVVVSAEDSNIFWAHQVDAKGPKGDIGPTGAGSTILVEDEGSLLATAADTLNFVGAGITASGTGTTKTVTVPHDHTVISVFAGDGLVGGGDITASRVIDAVGGEGITASGSDLSLDYTVATVTPVSGDFIQISDTSNSGNVRKVDASNFLGGGDKIFRQGHTYAISGEIKVPSGDTDFILPFFFSLATGQTASIVKARYSINSGTSVTAKLQRNGGDISGYTGISVTTTPAETVQAQALSDNDEIALVVTAVSATPTNMNFTIFIESTQ